MNFYEAQYLGALIGNVLKEKGWNVYGLYEDESNPMIDYYQPAAWEGVAEKNGFVLVFNNLYTQNPDGKMVDPTQTPFAEEDEEKMVFYPRYQKNQKGSKWHIEKNGEIVEKGRTIGQMYSWDIDRKINEKLEVNEGYVLSERDQKALANIKKFIEKIEKIVSNEAEEKGGSKTTMIAEATKEKKKQQKKLEVVENRKEVQEGDVLYLSNAHYQITEIENGTVWMIKIGSAKNGFKHSQSIYGLKNEWQEVIEKKIKNNQLKIYQIVEVKDTDEVKSREEMVQEIIEKDMKKMEEAIEKQEEGKTEEGKGMDEVLEELGKIKDEEITKELVGEWIWVGGYTWPHRETLKKLGFKWASKKKMWYWRAEENKKRGYGKQFTIEEIKERYRTQTL